jgi:acyl dehydratase
MINYEKLKAWPFEPREHTYTRRDTMLYALGLSLGGHESIGVDLRFIYEENLQCLPTFAGVLGYPGFWLKDPATGIDWRQVLNGEQGLVLHRPLAPEGRVIGCTHVTEIVDKGPGKGALLYTSRDVFDAETDELIATVTNTIFARGDGGFGGTAKFTRPTVAIPDRPSDMHLDVRTLEQSALIYRLSGDYNPLHADPAVARAAGYTRPILHGAASWGLAGYAVVRLLCNADPTRLRTFDARFSSPVYPGESIRTEVWHDGLTRALFRCRVLERDVVVLTNGAVTFA